MPNKKVPKLLPAKIKFDTTSVSTTYGVTSSAYYGYPESFEVELFVDTQYHSDNTTQTPLSYDTYDIKVGDWFGLITGKIYRVKSISTISDTNNITLVIEDKDIFNILSDYSQIGNNLPEEDQLGVIVEIGEDGLPICNPITIQSGSLSSSTYWISDIIGRFRHRNYLIDYYQVDPNDSYTGFNIGDFVYLSESSKYEKITDANKSSTFTKAFGIVSYIESDPGRISVRPFGKVISNLPSLPGATGSLVYFDPNGTYSITSTKPSSYVLPTYIKINETTGLLLNNHPSQESSGGSGDSSISVEDYNTGIEYTNISKITFRGGVINTPGSTALGSLVTGVSPNVVVWIPAPNYSGYFSPSFGAGGYSRYISTPTVNSYTSSVVPGQYDVGTWNTTSDFSANTARNVTNLSGTLVAVTETDFACYNTSTTISFYVYGANGTTIISSINNYIISGVGTTSSNGLTLTIGSFTNDSDRYKASITGSISVGTLFPNGGKFNWKIVHNNGEGSGYNNNGSTTYGIYEYTQTSPVFYDNDGTTSSASISGGIIFDELLATKVYYSGVAFYDSGSTFAFTASGINLLNDITIPTTNQITLSCTNLAISGNFPGYADGSKSGVGSIITGWNLLWDKSGLTYSRTLTINTSDNYIPGFSTNNTISSSPISYVTATVYDYGSVGNSQSISRSMLIDTDSTGSVTYSDNPIDSENGRLSMTDVMSNGSNSFTSTVTLPSDELQYIFGRIIFPQTDFTSFYPISNWTASVNYSGLTGSNKAFTVYTSLVASPTTTVVNFNDYRWHVTSYGKDASYLTSFTNGIFTFTSNFAEADLSFNGSTSLTGTNDLVIIVGIDSSGSSTTPDRFLYVSGDPVTYATRQIPGTYNLDAGTKQIQWSKGSLSTTVKKVWLFIGYKNTVRGKNLYMSNIHFA